MTIRKQMHRLFREQADMRTMRELRLEWHQTLEKVLLQPSLEPSAAQDARKALDKLGALASPTPSLIPIRLSAADERLLYHDKLTQAVEDL